MLAVKNYRTDPWCFETLVLERILDNGGTGDEEIDVLIDYELLRREQITLTELS